MTSGLMGTSSSLGAICGFFFVRLPFSLAVPHFVSMTLGEVIDGDAAGARRCVVWLVCCGTVDALLDFWTFFLFGTARGQLVFLMAVAVLIVVGGAMALMSTRPLYATTDPDQDGIFNPHSFTQCIWFGA